MPVNPLRRLFHSKKDTEVSAEQKIASSEEIEALVDEIIREIDHKRYFVRNLEKRVMRVNLMDGWSGGWMYED